jgi:hypothetical protein
MVIAARWSVSHRGRASRQPDGGVLLAITRPNYILKINASQLAYRQQTVAIQKRAWGTSIRDFPQADLWAASIFQLARQPTGILVA